jgi:hypothetical protein
MNRKAFIFLPITILLVFFVLQYLGFQNKKEMNVLLIPSLPKPIAKEYALITSAGQSTEAYIIYDIANKLMIHNYFMPQAKDTDLEGISTIVIAAGYSPLGEKISNLNYEDEKTRLTELLKKAKEKNLVVITIYISGRERRDKNTENLLRLVSPSTNYLIGTKDANDDGFLSALAKDSKIPLTLVRGVNDIPEPFVSAFR